MTAPLVVDLPTTAFLFMDFQNHVIARLGDMPVAVRRGGFIVLGSPLGPHLYAGDRDAHRSSLSRRPGQRMRRILHRTCTCSAILSVPGTRG